MPLGEPGPGARDPAFDGTGGLARLRVQDSDGDRADRHQGSSLVGVGMGAVSAQAARHRESGATSGWAQTSATPRRPWPKPSGRSPGSRTRGCAASRACTRRSRSGSSTSRSSGTPSWRSTSLRDPEPSVAALRCSRSSRTSNDRRAVARGAAGDRASSISTCSCSVGRSWRSSGRPRADRSTPRPIRRRGAAARRPASIGARAAVRPRAPRRPGARARAARLGRDRRDGPSPAARARGAGCGPGRRRRGTRPPGLASGRPQPR